MTLRTLLIAAALLTAGLPACAKRAQDSFVPGVTTVSQVKAALGEPEQDVSPKGFSRHRLHHYPDGCSYQYDKGSPTLSAYTCPPATADESTLQYWRHKWKGKVPIFEEVPGARDSHGRRTFRLLSPQDKMSVLYLESSERVVAVVRYGER